MSINEFSVDTNAIPGQSGAVNSVYMKGDTATIKLANRPLTAGPIPKYPNLPLDDPRQTFTDCRTIEGWTDTIHRLMNAAWGETDADSGFKFTHDYALLPQNPQDMKGAIIVYEIMHMGPGSRGKSGREIKPLLREVIPHRTSTSTVPSPDPHGGSNVVLIEENPTSTGSTWVWAQRFDACVRFMIYGDTWRRSIDYTNRTFDLIQTYTGIFRQAGLANLLFRQQGQDVLQDPPRVQEFPNQALYYDVTIERQTRATYATVEQILITAGIINPLTGAENDLLNSTVEGVPDSPILPSTRAQ